ncbi:MAG: translocase [Rhodobacteraceae bacterium]|nr:translocase [Alphaproteobacteria bacterium]NNK66330.1 translocase [Paracoccaceae bacterium]
MQYGVAGATRIAVPEPRPSATAPKPLYEIETTTLTSSYPFLNRPQMNLTKQSLPTPPADTLVPATLPDVTEDPISLPADTAIAPPADAALNLNGFGIRCDTELTATARRGALVALSLTSGCNPNASVSITHAGLSFSETTDATGQLALEIPALTSPAEFTVSVDDAKPMMAKVALPDIGDHDRVALQWTGTDGLSIHALEFGAKPGTPGHISADDPRTPLRSRLTHGGFLTHLGASDTEGTDRAEIYSFPTGTIGRDGVVRLHVEARVTPMTCDKTLEAQALQTTGDGDLRVVDLSVDIPGCEAVGDTLVLKNVLQDLKIAQN